mgnify:CR=1 FL=1
MTEQTSQIELIAIGDELLDGQIANTNSAIISEKLKMLGLKVSRHTVIPDCMETVISELRKATERSRLVIVTGGLGPTEDDLTAEAAAKAFGLEFKLNETVLELLKEYFVRINRPFFESNIKQAFLPEGAKYYINKRGTAPAFRIEHNGTRLYFGPGVPHESFGFMDDDFIPEIREFFSVAQPFRRHFRIFGLGESQLSDMLADLEKPSPVEFHYRVVSPSVYLTLIASESVISAEDFTALGDETAKRLGNHVYTEEERELAEIVIDLLRRNGKTLACAESCTGGLIATLITDIPGASDVFKGGAVTYSNEAKINILGVNPESLERFGAVSEEVARQMAEGAQQRFGADFAVSTSGIAGPGGGSPEKPVGTLAVGSAGPSGAEAEVKQLPPFGRLSFRRMAAYTALTKILRLLDNK